MITIANTLLLSILIFLSRVCDVSMGTVRIIFISKGKKFIAPLLGFFEVLIWLFAIQQIATNINSFWLYIAYAGGFATGTFIGIVIEDKLSLGKVLVRIVTTNEAENLIKQFKEKNFIVTISEAQGRNGKVKIIFTVTDRKKLKNIYEILNQYGQKTFYTVEDVRYAKEMNYFGISTQTNKLKFNRIGK